MSSDDWQRKSREMIGGCCVCLDETGWPDNKLVYCDGGGCNVAVHQACYGIISVPEGSWFCKRCESQERQVRLKCELCPSKDGALKRTDNGGWAHIVCALYIPEVKFGDNTTMEQIKITEVPYERFQKSCYICEDKGDSMNAKGKGACISCHYPSCRRSFHVTCAQSSRLLCEQETGSERLDYFGYCEHHISQQHNRNYAIELPTDGNDRSSATSSNSTTSVHSESKQENRPTGDMNTTSSVNGVNNMNKISKKDKLRDNPKGRARSVAHRNRGQHHRSKSMSKPYYQESSSDMPAPSTDASGTPHKKRMTMSAIIAGEECLPSFSDQLGKGNKSKPNSKKRHLPQKHGSKKIGKFPPDGMTDDNEGSPSISPSSPHSYMNEDSQISEIMYKSPSASCSPHRSEADVKNESEDSDNIYKSSNSETLKTLINQSWEGDTSTILENVSSYGDIASLLSLVYVIKSDNEVMKNKIDELSKKRDYLRAVNDGLKMALSAKDSADIPTSDKLKLIPQPEVALDPIKLRLTLDDVMKVEKVVNKIILSSEQS